MSVGASATGICMSCCAGRSASWSARGVVASGLWARGRRCWSRNGNDRWSLDFVSDQFIDGRRVRVLVVVDDCARECLALVPDTSISGTRVARELDRLLVAYCKPTTIVSDNGTELTSNAILRWG
jgi:putative transposase